MPRSCNLPFPNCYCGRSSTLKTSWTNKNPSRRFVSCSKIEGEGLRCDFFEWVDPEMCRRSVEVIPGLLRRIKVMEGEIDTIRTSLRNADDKNQKLKTRVQLLNKGLASQRYWCRVLAGATIICWLLCTFIFMSSMEALPKRSNAMALEGKRV